MLALGVSFALVACGTSSPTAPSVIRQLPRSLTANEQQLISQSNGFAFSLYRAVAAPAPDSNLFLSPLSATMALGMTMNGAEGSTLEAMQSTLGFSSMSLSDADASYESLSALLRGLDPHVDFQIANAIWYRQSLAVKPAFVQTNKQYFDATVEGLDFSSPSAAKEINAWASASTKGKITDIVGAKIDPSVVMYLTDAIYFKGAWQYQFHAGLTRSQPFHVGDGSTVSVPMMDLPGVTMPGAITPTYQAEELPYGGGAFAMDVIVPANGTTLDALVTELGNGGWQDLLSHLTPQTGDVEIPRFSLTWGASLRDPLTALGMGIAFGGGADFSGIADGGIVLSDVTQKAFVDVNEQGTTAAAVTTVTASENSITQWAFVADRPFLFVIRERLSGAILFMGQLQRPPAS
jgi:serpin B